jgi:hypothetical protein
MVCPKRHLPLLSAPNGVLDSILVMLVTNPGKSW